MDLLYQLFLFEEPLSSGSSEMCTDLPLACLRIPSPLSQAWPSAHCFPQFASGLIILQPRFMAFLLKALVDPVPTDWSDVAKVFDAEHYDKLSTLLSARAGFKVDVVKQDEGLYVRVEDIDAEQLCNLISQGFQVQQKHLRLKTSLSKLLPKCSEERWWSQEERLV